MQDLKVMTPADMFHPHIQLEGQTVPRGYRL